MTTLFHIARRGAVLAFACVVPRRRARFIFLAKHLSFISRRLNYCRVSMRAARPNLSAPARNQRKGAADGAVAPCNARRSCCRGARRERQLLRRKCRARFFLEIGRRLLAPAGPAALPAPLRGGGALGPG